jgi:hypothetical protein
MNRKNRRRHSLTHVTALGPSPRADFHCLLKEMKTTLPETMHLRHAAISLFATVIATPITPMVIAFESRFLIYRKGTLPGPELLLSTATRPPSLSYAVALGWEIP